MDAVSRIARAVLYEGYILWPYHRSAPKNRQRWTFGALLPESWSAEHPDDPCELQSQVLVEGPPQATLRVAVRFLQVVERRVGVASAGGLRWVDELHLGDERYLAWEEARERELALPERTLARLASGEELPLAIAAGRSEEPLSDPDGRLAGAIVRSWEALEGSVRARAEQLEPELQRVTLTLRNTTPWRGTDRQEGLRHAPVSTHVAWEVEGGAFVSLTDAPEPLRAHARACESRATWPVLAGEEGDRSTMLSAPIILEDHPRIAPESPGDLFDGGEIDQLLILNILGMSEAEKREMRDSDPRAREILERCAALGPEELRRLHGTIRELRPVDP